MKCFYLAQTTMAAQLPQHPSTLLPGGQWSLVVVERWESHEAQDAWEALPGVTELPIWSWGQPIPAAFAPILSPWGVAATDTIGQAMKKIRAVWPAARH
jgi:hypothetical protein